MEQAGFQSSNRLNNGRHRQQSQQFGSGPTVSSALQRGIYLNKYYKYNVIIDMIPRFQFELEALIDAFQHVHIYNHSKFPTSIEPKKYQDRNMCSKIQNIFSDLNYLITLRTFFFICLVVSINPS